MIKNIKQKSNSKQVRGSICFAILRTKPRKMELLSCYFEGHFIKTYPEQWEWEFELRQSNTENGLSRLYHLLSKYSLRELLLPVL